MSKVSLVERCPCLEVTSLLKLHCLASTRFCRKVWDRYILSFSPFSAVGGCDGAVFKDASHCWPFNEAQSDSSPDLKGSFPAQLKVLGKTLLEMGIKVES